MPELPEVEAIKLQLGQFLRGHEIQDIKIFNERILSGDTKKVIGGRVTGTRRFGKVTVIDLDNDYSILAHVKMTGQFIYRGPNLPNPKELSSKVVGGAPGPHTLVIFYLDKGGVLYYNDIRRFGWIKIVKSEQILSDKFIKQLGPEPLVTKSSSGQAILTLDVFRQILSKTKRSIKVVIMDQSKMGGVGNIYANDALWLAKLNPKRPSMSISASEAKALYEAIISVLKEGIKYGGSSENTFVTPDGGEGGYQRHTLVYGKQGLPCSRCGSKTSSAKASVIKIEKNFLGGRGTYFCPNCQK